MVFLLFFFFNFIAFVCDSLLFLCQGESGLMGRIGPAGLKGVEVCSILILQEFIILYDLFHLRMIDTYVPGWYGDYW